MTSSQRLEKLEREVLVLEARRNDALQRVQTLAKEVGDLNDEVEILNQVEAALIHLSQKVLSQSTGTFDKLVTLGLKSVFKDQNLEFKTTVDKQRGKTSVNFQLFENGETAPLADSYGGGVLAIVALLLRVVTVMALDLRRVLFLDESLAHLSSQYHEDASRLLKKLCADLDFKILMVSHQPAFAEYADRHYRAKPSPEGTIFELLSPSHNG